ncbi:hypothetical protein ID850_12040 [Xenorhabdus sp. Flor]|uniref:hypothetical protein n=1 Tax=Xenorhabdus cabanillasii TaxID=351673 RepID=UPI0019A7E73B|nr:hypothetical protein [Xenorhabdus sp. Flor]MBD2815487.1 hypothetical protein [Xenorhabdus sp. Flor]
MNNPKNKYSGVKRIFYRSWGKRAIDRMTEHTEHYGQEYGLLSQKIDIHESIRENIGNFKKKNVFMSKERDIRETQKERIKQEVERINLEKSFSMNFRSKNFYSYHATNNEVIHEGKLVLRSRYGIEKYNKDIKERKKIRINTGDKEIEFPCNHSSLDIKILGNDDYVFFSLGVGKNMRKEKSRFGNTFYRLEYKNDNPAFEYSSLVLTDQLNGGVYFKYTKLRKIISHDAIMILQKRCFNRYDNFFYGYRSNLAGLLNAIISTTRILPLEDAKKILSLKNDDDIDMIINELFRPEIRVPRIIVAEQGSYEVFSKNNPPD